MVDATIPPAALLMQSLLDGVGQDKNKDGDLLYILRPTHSSYANCKTAKTKTLRTATCCTHKADSFQLNCKKQINMQLAPKIILAGFILFFQFVILRIISSESS